jgi:hypothetical protein
MTLSPHAQFGLGAAPADLPTVSVIFTDPQVPSVRYAGAAHQHFARLDADAVEALIARLWRLARDSDNFRAVTQVLDEHSLTVTSDGVTVAARDTDQLGPPIRVPMTGDDFEALLADLHRAHVSLLGAR